ncbi:MAG: exodeoxyribonuclease VII large subunit [Bacillota bacterium]
MDQRRILSVSAVTRYLKGLLEGDPLLGALWVRGELSNFKRHSSGHLYFTLKDETAQLKGIMFRSRADRIPFQPENGLSVLVYGYISVYERDGTYQLYAEGMEPDGRGSLQLAFDQLKAKLQAEGLFDECRKRPIPRLPRGIGIATSPTGAALRDMVKIARRRFPGVNLVIAPAFVQGEGAPASLIKALRDLNTLTDIDCIIVGRGGGSMEELWAFNDEGLARAIAASRLPVVSAVGHETDFTIADFVADLRAPTPSAAAELVVPDWSELRRRVNQARERLDYSLKQSWERRRRRYHELVGRPVLARPLDRIRQLYQTVDGLERRLNQHWTLRAQEASARLGALAGRLEALSPLAVLGRGYTVTKSYPGGRALTSIGQLAVGDWVEVIFRDGAAICRVTGTGGREEG